MQSLINFNEYLPTKSFHSDLLNSFVPYGNNKHTQHHKAYMSNDSCRVHNKMLNDKALIFPDPNIVPLEIIACLFLYSTALWYVSITWMPGNRSTNYMTES